MKGGVDTMKQVISDLLAFCFMAFLVAGLGWFIFSPYFESFYVLFTIIFVLICILVSWFILHRGGGHF